MSEATIHCGWCDAEVPLSDPLPRWARGRSVRLRNALLRALADGELSRVTKATVRGKGEAWWLRRAHVGRGTVWELGVCVGWLTPKQRQRLVEHRREQRERAEYLRKHRPPVFGYVLVQYGVPITAQEAGVAQ